MNATKARYEVKEIPERKVTLRKGVTVTAPRTFKIWDNQKSDYMKCGDDSDWQAGPRIAKRVCDEANERI